jgi:putative membrane protein
MVRQIVENEESTARDHLANERTFLAWVRTALGLVGLGVLLERLGLGGDERTTVAAGVAFISFGGLTLVYSLGRYLRVARHLQQGKFPVAMRGPLAIALGALLIAAGALVYVISHQ